MRRRREEGPADSRRFTACGPRAASRREQRLPGPQGARAAPTGRTNSAGAMWTIGSTAHRYVLHLPDNIKGAHRMPPRAIVENLVRSHEALDEPMSAAVWIRQQEPAAWLVEVLPELPNDPEVLQPVVFSPSADFRYPLHLIAGRLESLTAALRHNVDLARAIADGEILHDSEDAQTLLNVARQVAAGAR